MQRAGLDSAHVAEARPHLKGAVALFEHGYDQGPAAKLLRRPVQAVLFRGDLAIGGGGRLTWVRSS